MGWIGTCPERSVTGASTPARNLLLRTSAPMMNTIGTAAIMRGLAARMSLPVKEGRGALARGAGCVLSGGRYQGREVWAVARVLRWAASVTLPISRNREARRSGSGWRVGDSAKRAAISTYWSMT